MSARVCVLVACLAARGLAATGQDYAISTLAGGSWAGDGGPATAAQLGAPEGLARDAAGNVYIADALDDRVRIVTPDGRIATFAGTGMRGFSGDGGPAAAAQLNQPYGLAIDSAGNVYVADLGNSRVRRIAPGGTITTVAGGGTAAPMAGFRATEVRLQQPRNLALDAAGNLYISDFAAHRVYRLAPGGAIFPYAGTGARGAAVDGPVPATESPLSGPAGLATDGAGRLYIADSENGVIRVVDNGMMTTLRSSVGAVPRPVSVALDEAGTVYVSDKFAGAVVRLGPPAVDLAARPAVNEPRSLCSGPDGVLYAGDVVPAEQAAGIVRKITSRENVLFAGNGTFRAAGDGLDPLLAHLAEPAGIAVDAAGAVLAADAGAGRIRKIASGVITTVAAGLNEPSAVAVDSAGFLWAIERSKNRVVKLASEGAVLFTVPLSAPVALAPAPGGGVYVADTGRGAVMQVSAGGLVWVALSVANPSGLATASDGSLFVAVPRAVYRIAPDGSVRTVANVEAPGRIALGPGGELFIACPSRHTVLRVDKDGAVKTVAGMGVAGFAGDGGPAAASLLNAPADVAVDAAGNVFIADSGNRRVRKLAAAGPSGPDAVRILAITNAASMLPAPVVPGALITLSGIGIGPEEAALGGLGASGSLKTSLAGYEVRFDGQPAPLLYTQAAQVTLQAPYSISGLGSAVVEVLKDGVRLCAAAIPVAEAAPGIFTIAGGAGEAAALNEDTQLNYEGNPAAPGSIVVFWATGEGRRDPPSVEGELAAAPYGKPVLPVTVTIGGRPAEVLYAGASPGFAGLMQINARIPKETPPGPQPLELIVGSVRSQTGVTIAVK